MPNPSLEVTAKIDQPRPSCERSGWPLILPNKAQEKIQLLVVLTKFTHILSVFIHRIRDCPGEDRDKADLLDLVAHYTHNVLEPFGQELRQLQGPADRTEVFQQRLDDLESNLRTVRGDSTEAYQKDSISACTPLELLIRCLWPKGESFSDADAALDRICESLRGLQLKESIDDLTKKHEWLRSPGIEGMPKMINFAIGSPFPGKGPLLFLGFTKESWPKNSPQHMKGTVNRENRFSPLQHSKHLGIRNEFYEVVTGVENESVTGMEKESVTGVEKKITSPASAENEESVKIRVQSVRKFWASHQPSCRFSTCRALSFPDFIIRQKCVICKATSNCRRDDALSLETDLRDPQSLKWHIKRDNFDCAEIMTEAGYEDLSTWSDTQQRQLEENPTHLMLAPPKSSGT